LEFIPVDMLDFGSIQLVKKMKRKQFW